MRFSERSFGAASVALGVVLITVMSTALAAFDGMGAWIVALLAGTVIGMLVVLAGVGIVGVSKAIGISEEQSLIDSVTGMPSAEKLVGDLADLISAGSDATFSLHLLDGFKKYNDAYGRACGDAMLAWLALKLREVVADDGVCYRMRGGEFALITRGDAEQSSALRARVDAALHETGEGFVISSSSGLAAIPGDASDVTSALKLADHRAVAQRKSNRHEPHAQPPEDPIETMRITPSRFDVVELASEVGRQLGLPADRLDDLAAAAHLRDIGNMALPAAVLQRAGELGPPEWHFIRLHTLVGERLLSANFAMTEVGRVVRSSHERWDGRGYPDGLLADQIPLGARIVFVCSAFEDMTASRPHRPALDVEAALEELVAGGGTQFDPAVVTAFTETLTRVQDEHRSSHTAAAASQRLRVLVADDDAASRFLLWRAVEAAGHECVTVSAGNEALETFGRELPDIVICDARLPEIEGNELCRLIRAEPHAPHTYFVMLTALGDLGLIRSGDGAGADDFLTKPISREALDQQLVAAAGVVAENRRSSSAG